MKRGGRESGSANATAPTGNADRGQPSSVPAAADPAAQSYCPQAGLLCALHYEERIRALEAALAECRKSYNEAEQFAEAENARAEKAEACVRELEAAFDGWNQGKYEDLTFAQIVADILEAKT